MVGNLPITKRNDKFQNPKATVKSGRLIRLAKIIIIINRRFHVILNKDLKYEF